MANHKLDHELIIRLANHQYPIHIAKDGLLDPSLLRRFVNGKQALVVTNQTIAPLYLEPICNALRTLQCDTVILPDGEAYKTQESLFAIYDALIKHNHHRDTTLFALGGGVIGDLTGFAASTYQRGVRFIQLPTTLLAQVDAAVGGKTAINHPLGKNMIGSFYQPHAVITDINTLKTLPNRELRAGFAEVIKYGLLSGGEFYEYLIDIVKSNITHLSDEQLAHIIKQCCQIKANYVEEDERETGKRALLNLGHTFAHALEAATNYNRWLHGEAVSIGLYCASLLSHQLGFLSLENLQELDWMLEQVQLPRRIPNDIDLQKIKELMYHDKKIKNNVLHLVLMQEPGSCYLECSVADQMLRRALLGAVQGRVKWKNNR